MKTRRLGATDPVVSAIGPLGRGFLAGRIGKPEDLPDLLMNALNG